MNTQSTSEWNGDTLTLINHYEHPEPHSRTVVFQRCEIGDNDCLYWVACDGNAYGLKVVNGESCIANVESAVLLAGGKACYVIWRPKQRTQSTIKTWVSKWGRRTATVDRWDGSIRCAA